MKRFFSFVSFLFVLMSSFSFAHAKKKVVFGSTLACYTWWDNGIPAFYNNGIYNESTLTYDVELIAPFKPYRNVYSNFGFAYCDSYASFLLFPEVYSFSIGSLYIDSVQYSNYRDVPQGYYMGYITVGGQKDISIRKQEPVTFGNRVVLLMDSSCIPINGNWNFWLKVQKE